MDFIPHSINWVKGEIFEATVFGLFGLFSFRHYQGTKTQKLLKFIPILLQRFRSNNKSFS